MKRSDLGPSGSGPPHRVLRNAPRTNRRRGVMSIYDYRGQPAYFADGDPSYCANPYILKWWSHGHDHLLARQLSRSNGCGRGGFRRRSFRFRHRDVIASWRAEDPLCLKYAWYNILMYFRSLEQKAGANGWHSSPGMEEMSSLWPRAHRKLSSGAVG